MNSGTDENFGDDKTQQAGTEGGITAGHWNEAVVEVQRERHIFQCWGVFWFPLSRLSHLLWVLWAPSTSTSPASLLLQYPQQWQRGPKSPSPPPPVFGLGGFILLLLRADHPHFFCILAESKHQRLPNSIPLTILSPVINKKKNVSSTLFSCLSWFKQHWALSCDLLCHGDLLYHETRGDCGKANHDSISLSRLNEVCFSMI